MASRFHNCLGNIIDLQKLSAVSRLYESSDNDKSFCILLDGNTITISYSYFTKQSFKNLDNNQKEDINKKIKDARDNLIKIMCGTEITKTLEDE